MASWSCIYCDRAGGHARANFDNKDLAKQFAERHAHAVAATDMPLKWEDAGTSIISMTQFAEYLVAPVKQQ
jgi:hypothetical protein